MRGLPEWLACSEDFVHDLGACRDNRPQFAAVHDLGRAGGSVPGQPGDLLDAGPRWLIRLTNEVRSSRGVQPSRLGIAGGAVYDALVALAAKEHGAALSTRDARARGTHDAAGGEVIVVT